MWKPSTFPAQYLFYVFKRLPPKGCDATSVRMYADQRIDRVRLIAMPWVIETAGHSRTADLMRLLDTQTGQFAEANLEETRYAVLSHTWDEEGEQTYEALKKIQRRYVSHRGGSRRGTSSSLRSLQRLTRWVTHITGVFRDWSGLSARRAPVFKLTSSLLCARLLLEQCSRLLVQSFHAVPRTVPFSPLGRPQALN